MTTVVLQIQMKDISGIGSKIQIYSLNTRSIKCATIYMKLANIYFQLICMQRRYLPPRKEN
jgi:hypothetical protein